MYLFIFFNHITSKCSTVFFKSSNNKYYIIKLKLVNAFKIRIYVTLKTKKYLMSNYKTILIVDDCFLDQQLVSDLFKRSMYVNGWSMTIIFALCLEEAKACLHTHQFDIITLDGQMGLEFGYDLIPFIEKTQTKKPDIIMISNHDKSIATGLDRGAHHAIVKDNITKNVRINKQFVLIPII